MEVISKIFDHLKSFFIAEKEWKEIEYFDNKWEDRVRKMASYISPYESVMDLGCGQMTLKKFLNANEYIPVDYTRRDKETLICDLNKKEFPKINVDVIFVSGSLEYIRNYKWLITQISFNCRKVILSYCSIEDFPSFSERKRNHWVNHLKIEKIVSIFKENNFSLSESTMAENKDRIMVFIHT